MEDKHRDILKSCHVALVNDLEPKKLFAHLIQENVMIPDDQEEITKIDRRMQRNEKFLSILPTKGPTAYQEFVKALEVNQSFLACKLLREELKVVEAKCKDLENRLKGKQEALNKSSITKHRERKTKYIKKKKKYARENLGLNSLKDEESVAMENIKYKNILLKFYVLLLENLDSNKVSRQLLTAGVLTSDDKEKIEERPSQKEKNEELLMMLATKGPRAYEEFVKALAKDQYFLACQLLKEEKEHLLYEVRESEWLLNETVNDLLMEEEKAITAAKENDKLKAQLEEAKNSVQRKKAVTLVEIAEIMEDLEGGWEELATAIQLGEENLHKIRKENKTNREKAYAVLTMWTNEEGEDATMGRLLDTIVKIAKRSPGKKMFESDELVDDQGEVNRLLKKSMDEISVENRKKRASGENSVDDVLKELGIQLPEEEDEDEQKEVAKLLKDVYDGISVTNRKKEGRKTSLEAAFKEPNTQPQEASSPGEKKPKRKGSKKKALAS